MNNRKDIRINAFTKDISKIKHIVAKHIDSVGGNVWKKNGEERAYFPENFNLLACDKIGNLTQPYSAYYDLNTGDFCCIISKQGSEEYTQSDVEVYKNAYKNILKEELAR